MFFCWVASRARTAHKKGGNKQLALITHTTTHCAPESTALLLLFWGSCRTRTTARPSLLNPSLSHVSLSQLPLFVSCLGGTPGLLMHPSMPFFFLSLPPPTTTTAALPEPNKNNNAPHTQPAAHNHALRQGARSCAHAACGARTHISSSIIITIIIPFFSKFNNYSTNAIIFKGWKTSWTVQNAACRCFAVALPLL